MPWRPVIYLHRREEGLIGGQNRSLLAAGTARFSVDLAIFESLPELLVGSLASADIATNEFVNFLKIQNNPACPNLCCRHLLPGWGQQTEPELFWPELMLVFEMTLSPSPPSLPAKQEDWGLEGDIFQVKSFALGTTSIRQQGEC